MIYREIAWIEPIAAAERLAGLPLLSFLDSAMAHPELGGFSYIAADPFAVFTVEDGEAQWNSEPLFASPLAALREKLARFPGDLIPGLPPFQGGAIGVFAYEFGWALDHGPAVRHRPEGQTVHLGFYDTVLAFDHKQRRCWVIGTGWPAPAAGSRRRRAEARVAFFTALVSRQVQPEAMQEATLGWHPSISRDSYRAAIERVKESIRAGEVYQANVAQTFSALVPPGCDTLALYKRLRDANPAPFAAYLDCGSMAVLSSSPERFLRTTGKAVETRPIKGTARRALDVTEDAAISLALTRSAKDRAENVMIVDLLRNDLSRVCIPASVDVPVLCGLESYAGLHHLVSVVTGTLRADCDALDLIGATFPGGSITGAPKIRAMEIIAEIEGERRGLYCGAIGAIGFNGDLDLNIAIRTLVVADGVATLKTGGGITILSDPDVEYEETLTKAHRIFAAFSAPVVAAMAPA